MHMNQTRRLVAKEKGTTELELLRYPVIAAGSNAIAKVLKEVITTYGTTQKDMDRDQSHRTEIHRGTSDFWSFASS